MRVSGCRRSQNWPMLLPHTRVVATTQKLLSVLWEIAVSRVQRTLSHDGVACTPGVYDVDETLAAPVSATASVTISDSAIANGRNFFKPVLLRRRCTGYISKNSPTVTYD